MTHGLENHRHKQVNSSMSGFLGSLASLTSFAFLVMKKNTNKNKWLEKWFN